LTQQPRESLPRCHSKSSVVPKFHPKFPSRIPAMTRQCNSLSDSTDSSAEMLCGPPVLRGDVGFSSENWISRGKPQPRARLRLPRAVKREPHKTLESVSRPPNSDPQPLACIGSIAPRAKAPRAGLRSWAVHVPSADPFPPQRFAVLF
jgi:hypothetical protein